MFGSIRPRCLVRSVEQIRVVIEQSIHERLIVLEALFYDDGLEALQLALSDFAERQVYCNRLTTSSDAIRVKFDLRTSPFFRLTEQEIERARVCDQAIVLTCSEVWDQALLDMLLVDYDDSDRLPITITADESCYCIHFCDFL